MHAIRFVSMMAGIAAVAMPARADRVPSLVVPQVSKPIVCDGELDEVAWRTPVRTGPFVDSKGSQAAPYSEARFLRDDKFLYIALYAADEDIRSTDEFVVELGGTTLRFSAAGKITPSLAGTQVGVDLDGTLDDSSNDDEEWVIEAAVPLAAISFSRDGGLDARVSRCDRTKDGVKRCGAWKGRIVRR